MPRKKYSKKNAIGLVSLLVLAFIVKAVEELYTWMKETIRSTDISVFIAIGAVVLLIIFAKLIITIRRKMKETKYEEYLQEQEILSKQKDIERRDKLISKHKDTLVKKYKQLTYKDDYGDIQKTAFVKELDYFIRNVLFKDLPMTQDDYDYDYNRIVLIIENEVKDNPQIEFSDNPYDFEKQCAEILNNHGWEARTTQKSADQGIDVIATKNNITVALQCKLYSKPVGNKAVQEAFSGKKYYQADYAGVVSNNTYTTSARSLAKNCNVLLLSPDDLPKLDTMI